MFTADNHQRVEVLIGGQRASVFGQIRFYESGALASIRLAEPAVIPIGPRGIPVKFASLMPSNRLSFHPDGSVLEGTVEEGQILVREQIVMPMTGKPVRFYADGSPEQMVLGAAATLHFADGRRQRFAMGAAVRFDASGYVLSP